MIDIVLRDNGSPLTIDLQASSTTDTPVTPGNASLTLTAFAPTVVTTGDITVSTATATAFATSVTTMAVDLPTVSSGDLLIASVGVRNAGTWTVPTDWVLLAETAGGGAVGETGVWYKIADGTEGATATWTAGTATTAAWHVRKITYWHGTTPPEYTTTNGDAASVDPPTLTPSWGSDGNAWIALAGSSANTMTFTGAPTGYTDLATTTASSGGGASNMGSAYKIATGTSDDPSTFTTSTNRWWASFTVAVRPSAGGGVIDTLVTPSLATITTTTFAPTVVATNNVAITTASPTTLTTSVWSPTVAFTANYAITTATPTALTLTGFAPTVSATSGVTVTPATASLTLTQQNPSVSTSSNVAISPGTVSITTSLFAPTVSVSDNKTATPDTASLTLTQQTPNVVINQIITPDVLDLSLSTFAPNVVSSSGSVSITPTVASMITTMFAPTVFASDNKTATPQTAQLRLKGTRPIVNGIVPTKDYYIDSSGNVYWVINQDIGLVEKI